MPYSSKHKHQTRARIVSAARGLFNRRGFAEVSIDDIMAAAGLTRGGFYNHFGAKDDLLAEILLGFTEEQENMNGGTAIRRQPTTAARRPAGRTSLSILSNSMSRDIIWRTWTGSVR